MASESHTQDEIEDIVESNAEHGDSLTQRLASPLDRMAAFVADLIVFMPVMAVGMAPFRRQALLAQIMNHEGEWMFALASAVGVGVLSTVLYQTAFVALWGSTPGKRMLGLKVVSIWGDERPRWISAFIRSVTWCLEAALLGLPWLAVFGNERRRPLHDRAADTVVITLSRRRAAGPPGVPEMSLASGAYAAVLACVAILTVTLLAHMKAENGSSARVIAGMEEQGLLCKAVGEAKEEWLSGVGAEHPTRLAIAMALFGSEAIDESCLEEEADFAIWREQNRSLAYLAKGLTKDPEDKMRATYFDKACAQDPIGDACKLIRFIGLNEESGAEVTSPEEKAEQAGIENEIESIVEYARNGGPVYLRVWSVKSLMASREFGRVLDMTSDASPHRLLGYFFARERAKALWGIDRKAEARVALRSSIENVDTVRRVELASWFCAAETADGSCGEEARWACDLLTTAVEKEEQWLASEEVAASYVRGSFCRSEADPKMLTKMSEKISHKDGRLFVEALEDLRVDRRAAAVAVLKSIGREADDLGPFYFEAKAKLVDLATTSEDLEAIRAEWVNSEPSDGWTLLGTRLMTKLQSFQSWERSLEVGLKLVEADRFNRQLLRSIVVSSYRAGHRQMALGFLQNIAHLDQAVNSRAPASQNEFDDVILELSKTAAGGKR